MFLYDCLDLSMALGLNYVVRDQHRTDLGKLEYDAKERKDDGAIDQITTRMVKHIKMFTPLLTATAICAVPKQEGKDFHLPEASADIVAKSLNKPNLTANFGFNRDKPSLKDLPLTEKWIGLEDAGFHSEVRGCQLEGEEILLIDDKYQSGTTMQFVASKLQALGATATYGLCVVKTLRNDDNWNKK